MKLYITDQKQIAENLAQHLKTRFNIKKGYYENDGNIVLFIEPAYSIALGGAGRKLIKFYDGADEICAVLNYSVYRDILKIKTLIQELNPEVINICNPNSRGQMNYEIVCLCAGIDSTKTKRIWLRSNLIDNSVINGGDPNSKYYSMYQALLCETIIDRYWSLRGEALFGEEFSEKNLNMKEMFLLNMVAAREVLIESDNTAGSEYFRIEAKLRDKTFKWLNKKKEDRLSTIEEAGNVANSIPGHSMLVTKIDDKLQEKEHPMLYNSTDLYKDIQKNKIATIKELNNILSKLFAGGYISNPDTESRHLPMDFVTSDGMDGKSKLTDIISSLKVNPMYRPYIDYMKKSNEYIELSSRVINDKYVDNHHAIIPTAKTSVVHNLTAKEYAVYDLIVKRFLTVFLGNQIENTVTITGYVDANNHLKYEETKLIKAGWKVVYETQEDLYELLNACDSNHIEVKFSVGEYVPIAKPDISIHAGSSRGVSRYTVAALIDLMGNCGKTVKGDNKKVRLRHLSIGLPDERNIIINDVLEKGLIEVIEGKVHLTTCGHELISAAPKGLLSLQLLETFNNKIKDIEQERTTVFDVLREHTSYITKVIFNKANAGNQYKLVDYSSITSNRKCRFCQGDLQDKGDFIGCMGYPKCEMSIPKEKNQHTLTEKDILQLLDVGITDLITDFTFRNGQIRKGKAKLQFNIKRKVEFVFEQNKRSSD